MFYDLYDVVEYFISKGVDVNMMGGLALITSLHFEKICPWQKTATRMFHILRKAGAKSTFSETMIKSFNVYQYCMLYTLKTKYEYRTSDNIALSWRFMTV